MIITTLLLVVLPFDLEEKIDETCINKLNYQVGDKVGSWFQSIKLIRKLIVETYDRILNGIMLLWNVNNLEWHNVALQDNSWRFSKALKGFT